MRHPESVFDRIEPRIFGMVAVGLLSGLLLGVVALTLLRGGDTSTAAGPGINLPGDAVAGSQDPSDNGGAEAAGSVPGDDLTSPTTVAPEISTTSIPASTTSSTTTPTTVTTVPTTAAITTAPSTTEPSTTEADSTTTASTAAPSTDTSSTETTTSSTTAVPTTAASTSTTVAPTTATTRPDTSGDAAIQQQVLDATNVERAAAGCPPLRLDPTLNGAADAHSEDMAARGYFDHDDPEGRGPGDRINASGYPHGGWGENIAAGYGSAAAVVEGWMNSSGHRANILDCSFDELGVGYAEPGRYWTQLFATRR